MPVHLKGGASDALLYRLTMGLTVGGKTLFECLQDTGSGGSFLAFAGAVFIAGSLSHCTPEKQSRGQLEYTNYPRAF